MDHFTWMDRHQALSERLAVTLARRDELQRLSGYLPGPIYKKRDRELERDELATLAELGELQALDRAGAVS